MPLMGSLKELFPSYCINVAALVYFGSDAKRKGRFSLEDGLIWA